MSTFTDGAPPSVSPGPDEPSGPDHGEDGVPARSVAAAPRRRAHDREPDREPVGDDWLRAEIQRRMAARSSDGGGRHARRGASSSSKAPGYAPRHSVAPSAPPQPTPRRRGADPAVEHQPQPGEPSTVLRFFEPPAPGTPAANAASAWLRGAAPATDEPQAAPPPAAVETGPVPVEQPADPAPEDREVPANGEPTGPNPVIVRVASPSWPATPVGPGLPNMLPPTPGRAHGRRPAPPTGSAVGRLLSLPPSPPSTPTGIPVETGPVPLPPRVGPRPTASPELEASGQVLWTSLTPADAAAPTERRLPVPAQRGAEPDVADVDQPTAGIATVEPAPRPAPESAREPAPESAPESGPEPIRRVRVVLAERKAIAHPVRTVVDVQEGTGVGEVLRRNLIRSQLRVALSFAAAAVLTLGVLPLVFAYLPEINRISVGGMRLPWLLLGFLVYPFLLGLGWWHTRTAERVEQNFADHVQE